MGIVRLLLISRKKMEENKRKIYQKKQAKIMRDRSEIKQNILEAFWEKRERCHKLSE